MLETRETLADQQGFTLVELMVTVAVAAFIAAIAVPNFGEFLRNNARATRLNEMIAAFNIARSEAVTRRGFVSICAKKADLSECDTAASGAFDNGWLVFTDADTDGVVDAGEEVLREFDPGMIGAAALTFTPKEKTNKLNFMSYDARGRLKRPSGVSDLTFWLRYCDKRGATGSASAIELSPSGQARVLNKSQAAGETKLKDGMRCPS